jgi:putative transposase
LIIGLEKTNVGWVTCLPTKKPQRMPNYKRAYINGGTFFFTVVTYNRIPVFKNEPEIDLLKSCLTEVIQIHPFKIEAIVILPDHIHTLWKLPDDDNDFSTRWRIVKKKFSLKYPGLITPLITDSMLKKQEKGIWQRRFWEHLIRDEDDFNLHCDYIHYNPVKHGLVSSPEMWKYSSYNEFVEKGFSPKNWGVLKPKKLANVDLE